MEHIFRVGDAVRRKAGLANNGNYSIGENTFYIVDIRHSPEYGTHIIDAYGGMHTTGSLDLIEASNKPVTLPFHRPKSHSDKISGLLPGGWDANYFEEGNVEPDHYKFPSGVEVRQISAYLTSFGGQALQYVARATRLDGANKGNPVEDLKKAVKFIEWEIERLEAGTK